MMFKSFIISSIFFYFSISVFPQVSVHWATGNVYEYTQNIKYKKGFKNVLVSNGDTIVKTGKNGVFKIPVKEGQVVFPILPSGYKYLDAQKWWHLIPNHIGDKSIVINFNLQTTKEKKDFKLLAIGDIQVGDKTELLQATQSVLTELLNRADYDFSIYLGDLVNDTPELFKPLKNLINNVKPPSWVVYGNHDRNFNTAQSNQQNIFRSQFGPETYAFYKNKVLFISLNSITPVGKYGYKNIYPENQFKFLSQLIADIDPDQPIVISQHIPLIRMKNKDKILKLLDPFKNVLVLSGHTHTISQNYIKTASGNVIHELTAGAVCGNWWRGQKNWEGIPLALMSCGAPRGYFEIDYKNLNYKIKYKGVALPENKQVSIWQGDYNANPLSNLSSNNELYVNVFMGSEHTKVSLVIPGYNQVTLQPAYVVDPFVNFIKKSQKAGKSPDKYSEKSPYLSKKSSHLWKGVVPNDIEKGSHKIKLIIEDPNFEDFEEFFWLTKE